MTQRSGEPIRKLPLTYDLLSEVSKQRKDIQSLKPQTALPPVNFYNSFNRNRGNEKAYLAKVRR